MQRITICISDEQAAELKDEQRRSGAPVSLQIRRALKCAAYVNMAGVSTVWSKAEEERQKASTEK